MSDHLKQGNQENGQEKKVNSAAPLFTKGSLLKGLGKGVANALGKKVAPDAGAAALKSFEDRRAQNRLDFELQMKILRDTDVICTTTIALVTCSHIGLAFQSTPCCGIGSLQLDMKTNRPKSM